MPWSAPRAQVASPRRASAGARALARRIAIRLRVTTGRLRGIVFQYGETWLFWTASTDNNTPASSIAYRVIVNGVLDHTPVGNTRTILYVPVGQTSRIDVVALDEAGNQSAPATIFVTP